MLTCSGDPFVSYRAIEQDRTVSILCFLFVKHAWRCEPGHPMSFALKLNHYVCMLTIDRLLIPLQHYAPGYALPVDKSLLCLSKC
jgi:hypothetical protein